MRDRTGRAHRSSCQFAAIFCMLQAWIACTNLVSVKRTIQRHFAPTRGLNARMVKAHPAYQVAPTVLQILMGRVHICVRGYPGASPRPCCSILQGQLILWYIVKALLWFHPMHDYMLCSPNKMSKIPEAVFAAFLMANCESNWQYACSYELGGLNVTYVNQMQLGQTLSAFFTITFAFSTSVL